MSGPGMRDPRYGQTLATRLSLARLPAAMLKTSATLWCTWLFVPAAVIQSAVLWWTWLLLDDPPTAIE